MAFDRKAARKLCDNYAGVPVGELVNAAEGALDLLDDVERMCLGWGAAYQMHPNSRMASGVIAVADDVLALLDEPSP